MAILPIAVVLATLSLGLSATEVPRAGKEYNTRSFSSVLTVTNGQTWGEWKWREMCPDNTYAVGFSLRVKTMYCVCQFIDCEFVSLVKMLVNYGINTVVHM